MEAYHILIVEDDKEILDGVGIYMKNQGYEVFKAQNGLEGLKILEKEEIHLAIIDIMMPVMDGITMTMKLREALRFSGDYALGEVRGDRQGDRAQYRGG